MKAGGHFPKVYKEFKFFVVTSVVMFLLNEHLIASSLLPHDFRAPIFVLTVTLRPSDTTSIDMH